MPRRIETRVASDAAENPALCDKITSKVLSSKQGCRTAPNKNRQHVISHVQATRTDNKLFISERNSPVCKFNIFLSQLSHAGGSMMPFLLEDKMVNNMKLLNTQSSFTEPMDTFN